MIQPGRDWLAPPSEDDYVFGPKQGSEVAHDHQCMDALAAKGGDIESWQTIYRYPGEVMGKDDVLPEEAMGKNDVLAFQDVKIVLPDEHYNVAVVHAGQLFAKSSSGLIISAHSVTHSPQPTARTELDKRAGHWRLLEPRTDCCLLILRLVSQFLHTRLNRTAFKYSGIFVRQRVNNSCLLRPICNGIAVWRFSMPQTCTSRSLPLPLLNFLVGGSYVDSNTPPKCPPPAATGSESNKKEMPSTPSTPSDKGRGAPRRHENETGILRQARWFLCFSMFSTSPAFLSELQTLELPSERAGALSFCHLVITVPCP